MNRRGLEISMANPVNETISYQTHYVAESGGEGGLGRAEGDAGRKASPGTRDARPRVSIARIALVTIVFLFPRRAKHYWSDIYHQIVPSASDVLPVLSQRGAAAGRDYGRHKIYKIHRDNIHFKKMIFLV